MRHIGCANRLPPYYRHWYGVTGQTIAVCILGIKGDGPSGCRFHNQSQSQLSVIVISICGRRNMFRLKFCNRRCGVVTVIIPTYKHHSLRQSHCCTARKSMLLIGIVFNGIVRRLRTIQSHGVRINIVNIVRSRGKGHSKIDGCRSICRNIACGNLGNRCSI